MAGFSYQAPPGVVSTSGPSQPGADAGRGFEEYERRGHPQRRFRVAVSVGAMGLAWARQEEAPPGATVVADHEVSPLGRLGDHWTAPAAETLAAAVVVRPSLPTRLADAVWLVAGLAAAEGAGEVAGRPFGVWWPDTVVDPSGDTVVGKVKAEVQLGPTGVRSAVCTLRLDMARLGVEPPRREEVLDAVLDAFDRGGRWLESGEDGCAEAAVAYGHVCPLLGRRVKVWLLPKGETRGFVQRVDAGARLELTSATGMVEHVAIDAFRRMEVAESSPPDSPN